MTRSQRRPERNISVGAIVPRSIAIKDRTLYEAAIAQGLDARKPDAFLCLAFSLGDLTILSEDPASGYPEAFTKVTYTIRGGNVIWHSN